MNLFLKASWQQIIMANYEVPASVLKPFLPKSVELDVYNNKVYVSLVGFMFKNTKLFNKPIPLLGTFEEVNLRFYVVRKENGITKRGVVFINETVPYKAVAWIANILYHENYTCVPTKHHWEIKSDVKTIDYQWLLNKQWQSIRVNALNDNNKLKEGTFEEFIFEHYYGYAKVNENTTEEYEVLHPKWETQTVLDFEIKCDFEKMYGSQFSFLNKAKPHSVFITNGSDVSIKWKRNKL